MLKVEENCKVVLAFTGSHATVRSILIKQEIRLQAREGGLESEGMHGGRGERGVGRGFFSEQTVTSHRDNHKEGNEVLSHCFL